MHIKLLIVTFDHHKFCRDNMDHCLLGSKQQLTCFPYYTPNKFKSIHHQQQQIEGNWKIDATDCLDPQYEGLNQDIRWITKLKWKRNLKVRNAERSMKVFLASDSQSSLHNRSYLLSTKRPVFSRRRVQSRHKFSRLRE